MNSAALVCVCVCATLTQVVSSLGVCVVCVPVEGAGPLFVQALEEENCFQT